MRPLSLSVEGFGAFRQRVDVDFADAELLALVGPTGAGKSTIIDAITFALYGSVVRYEDNRAVAPVINQIAAQARVQLDFELAGRTYRAVRVVRRTKQGGATTPEARLERGAEVLAADARGTTAAVTDLLALDAEQFNKTVVLPQGRFAEFLHDRPGDRQATLRRLLDLGLYERMGRAARQRGATARAQLEGYTADLGALERQLTDERRAALVARARALDDAHADVARAIVDVERLDGERRVLDARLDELDRALGLLGGVHEPAGLTGLDDDQRTAADEVAAAGTRLDAAREVRRVAVDRAAAGPDLVTATLQQEVHARHRQLVAEGASVVTALEGARRHAATAAQAAARVHSRWRALEEAADSARAAERAAADALDRGPDEAATRGLLAARDRHDAAAGRIDGLDAAVATTERAVDDAVRGVGAADAAERERAARLEAEQLRAGATGLVASLHVGDLCPVCQQTVHELPDAHGDAELESTRAAHRAARDAAASARAELDVARRAAATASAEAATVRRELHELAAAVAGAPDRAALVAGLEEIATMRAAATATRATAVAASAALDAARREPDALAAVEAADAAGRGLLGREAAAAEHARQLTEAAERRRDIPDETAVAESIAEARRLAKDKDQADEEFTRAEADHADARRRCDDVEQRVVAARAALGLARDAVAALDPPPLDTADVTAAWGALTAWVDAATQHAIADRDAVVAARRDVTDRRDRIGRDATERAASVLAGPAGGLGELRDALARARAEAAAALDRFDADRTRLAELRTRITGLRETAAVAESLGRLLSATGFEAWLMAAALDDLCARATDRLLTLSGGQFSLVVDDREFLVRDHANADELRNVRTLSGGETFLASLALALALAEATADLAPAGAPTIESIFLDEGFGTLDPDTMETVAGAIEELGASGRMVVIVTHIRELAERMPVRLEVTKTASGSTVRRVEV